MFATQCFSTTYHPQKPHAATPAMSSGGVHSSLDGPAVIFGYFAGLATTIAVMNVFNAAQPALLYIVPGILGATFLRALIAGGVKELKEIWAFVEAGEEEGADEPKKSK